MALVTQLFGQTICLETMSSDRHSIQGGHVLGVVGCAVTIALDSQFAGSEILSVTTIGKEPSTKAEDECQRVVAMAFHGRSNLLQQPFFRAIYLSDPSPPWEPTYYSRRVMPRIRFPARRLNVCQEDALYAILSSADRHRVVMIHGPPGTGKTTVIAAAVHSTMAANSQHGVWLLAQSNVAVKNIAEQLASSGFMDFRLLVSDEYHFDWYVVSRLLQRHQSERLL